MLFCFDNISKMEGEKTQRKSYTREFKLKVVDWLKANEHNVSATARQFGVSNKRVRDWRESESSLKEQSRVILFSLQFLFSNKRVLVYARS